MSYEIILASLLKVNYFVRNFAWTNRMIKKTNYYLRLFEFTKSSGRKPVVIKRRTEEFSIPNSFTLVNINTRVIIKTKSYQTLESLFLLHD
jgi:hypothetical protein